MEFSHQELVYEFLWLSQYSSMLQFKAYTGTYIACTANLLGKIQQFHDLALILLKCSQSIAPLRLFDLVETDLSNLVNFGHSSSCRTICFRIILMIRISS